MNLALRKLVMLDKEFCAKEEAARLDGFTTCPVDPVFREKVSRLMEQIKVL